MALSGLAMVMGAPVSMVTRCGLSPIQHMEFRLLSLFLAYMLTMQEGMRLMTPALFQKFKSVKGLHTLAAD
jgi:hypothetical protein